MAQLTSNGIPLDMAPDAFGELRESNDLLNDMSALRERMAEDGYLLIRDYLDLEWVMDARRSVLEVLAEHEMIDENHSLMEARAARSDNGKFRSAIGSHAALGKLPAVRKLVHSGRMIDFYAAFLGGEVRSFDFIWMRVMGPGQIQCTALRHRVHGARHHEPIHLVDTAGRRSLERCRADGT